MWPKPTESVLALVCASEWSDASLRAVQTSLRGQVEQINFPDQVGHEDPSAVLVVSAPVVFARGAVKRLQRRAAHPGRIVTRVLVPGLDSATIALWSMAWLRRQRVDLKDLPACGLRFDHDHLPHDDPQARAWVRADEVGVAIDGAHGAKATRWVWIEGIRLQGRIVLVAVRAVLGQIRRARTLSMQRRRQSRFASAQVR